MKKRMAYLSVMFFGYLIFSMGLGKASDLMPSVVKSSMHLSVAVAEPAPQAGAPVGLPNGTPHQSTLGWTASTPVSGVTVAGYNVYRSTTPGGEAGTSAINGTTLVTTTSYVDSSVTQGTKYYYVVAAQSSTGNQSGFSNEASATIPANPSNPTGCTAAGQ